MVVNWTNEEGSRFAPAMLGAGVHVGVFDEAYAYDRTDVNGERLETALDGIGYRGEVPVGQVEMSAMFELHIEQGPILEAEDKMIGIVQGVQGMRWFDATVEGREAHTGSTPMSMRHNALVGSARLIDAVDAIAHAHAPLAVGTVGSIEVQPNSRNVIPGRVELTVDTRHPDDAVLDVMEEEIRAKAAAIGEELGLTVNIERIWLKPAVKFDPDCVEAVRKGAEEAGHSAREIISGAGHDAAYVAEKLPTTMIFVPCDGGLSHNEAENISFEQAAAGAQVLCNAVMIYDERFA